MSRHHSRGYRGFMIVPDSALRAGETAAIMKAARSGDGPRGLGGWTQRPAPPIPYPLMGLNWGLGGSLRP